MVHLVVIGAGPMGLAAAYFALKAGHTVDVVEAGDRVGGMAAHFDFDGLSIERFYHFACKADAPTFALMAELGIADKMRWRPTSMGYYIGGKVHRWGDPLSLLRFPELDPISKLRYGLQMFLSTKRSDWHSLDGLSARDWLVSGSGQRAYDVLWKRLMDLKFYELAGHVSAAWMWTRIKRVGTSRKSIFQEELGYIEGGSEAFMLAIAARIEQLGGRIHLSMPAERIRVAANAVVGVSAGGKDFPAAHVVSTVPIPFVPHLAPDLPASLLAQYRAIRNIGVVCVLHKLRRSVSPHFWMNIVDEKIEIPGLVEFSNLRPLPATIVYVPYYMPTSNPKFARPDDVFVAESIGYIRRVNPDIGSNDIIASHVGRLRYAQPICEPRFLEKLPSVETPIRGLQIADTCYYYPEDRGISESIRFSEIMISRLPR